jgi:hypothetical protein
MYETVSHNGSLVAILELRKFIVTADGLYFNGTEQKQKSAYLLSGKKFVHLSSVLSIMKGKGILVTGRGGP